MLYFREKISGLILEIRNIHEINNNDRTRVNYNILLNASSKILILVNVFLVMTVCTMLLFAIYPLGLYLVTGTKVPIIPMYMPYLDEDTIEGYMGMSFFHLSWLTQTGLGLAAADLLITSMILFILPMVELFRARFKELTGILNLGKKAQESDFVYQCLRNLVKMHQDISK